MHTVQCPYKESKQATGYEETQQKDTETDNKTKIK